VEVFFDSSVLVAASERSHPHYARALPALKRVTAGQDHGFISGHSIAEVYAVLTRIPVRPRIHPTEAARIIRENIIPHFEVVPIGKKDYLQALNAVADGGWSGGKVYDALLINCATRSAADRIYTFNLTDFRRLAPDGLRDKIAAP